MATIQLPKNALHRVNLGQLFAEYDIIKKEPGLFVTTPASLAAENPESQKCIFVGRRGAGKTAITLNVAKKNSRTKIITPQTFDLVELPLKYEEFKDTRQRPFKSLVNVFERTLLLQLAREWKNAGLLRMDRCADVFSRERNIIENCDFDTTVLTLTNEIFEAYSKENPRLWLRQIKRSEELIEAIKTTRQNASYDYTIIIDRIDESWDGSDSSIISLMALMHASVRLQAALPSIRPFLFIRENIFERLRQVDNEFSRIESACVFLDWSETKLIELIERRLIHSFSTKPAIGEIWPHFFEDAEGSRSYVLKTSQGRPRDILMLTNFALDSAISNGHQKITLGDLTAATERYSTSRLKDLADEFTENYQNIGVVIGYFYNLSTSYSILAIEQFIQRLLIDPTISKMCGAWFFNYSTPHLFIELLYRIGFVGIKNGTRITFRGSGLDASFFPRTEQTSTILIHPTYHAALQLSDVLLTQLPESVQLKQSGVLEELPEGFSAVEYRNKLEELSDKLKHLALGTEGATAYEDAIGEMIHLCFFRSLTNVQAKARSIDGKTIKDWIASNRARDGFWQMVREKHGATQIIWECKNYKTLSSDDYHQVSYYLNDSIGRFAIIVFRGDDITTSDLGHIHRILNIDKKGLILPLRQRDVETFIRQALSGKTKEGHIRDIYDRIIRSAC